MIWPYCFFCYGTQIFKKHQENPTAVDPGLFALACGPNFRVKTYSACVVDGVWFLTADREKGKKTQNSGVMSKFAGKDMDFYGVLKEIKVLSFNSNTNGQLCCSTATGFGLEAWRLSWRTMTNCSGASTLPIFGTKMTNTSWPPKQQKSFMCQTPC